jgi:hypothetical protein
VPTTVTYHELGFMKGEAKDGGVRAKTRARLKEERNERKV